MISSVSDKFSHRHNEDGTFDSVCRDCFMTIATANVECDLDASEKRHVCDAGILRHIEVLRMETS